MCELCGAEDTIHHRVADKCHATVPGMAMELRRDFWNGVCESESALRARQAGFRQQCDAPMPMQDGFVFWSASGETDPSLFDWRSACLFTDGSCSKHACRQLWGAGWAIVIWSKDGEKLAAAHGPVWRGLPQTSAAAEHCAMCVLAQLLARAGSQGERDDEEEGGGGPRAHADNTGVQRAWSKPLLASQASRPYGGLYRVATARPGAGDLEVKWVKGHHTVSGDMTDHMKWEAEGNDAADSHARQGREINELWHQDDSDEWAKEATFHKQLLCHVGRALAVWARLPRTAVEWAAQSKAESLSKPEIARGDAGHCWVWSKAF